jgi:hypothetical protein
VRVGNTYATFRELCLKVADIKKSISGAESKERCEKVNLYRLDVRAWSQYPKPTFVTISQLYADNLVEVLRLITVWHEDNPNAHNSNIHLCELIGKNKYRKVLLYNPASESFERISD